jgi:hypothetical protein
MLFDMVQRTSDTYFKNITQATYWACCTRYKTRVLFTGSIRISMTHAMQSVI